MTTSDETGSATDVTTEYSSDATDVQQAVDSHRAGVPHGLSARQAFWWDLLAHPLASVLVGFVLTGLIGWVLTTWYNERQKQNDLARARYENGTAAAQDFARVVYRRYTRGTMLYSALLRDADLEELRQRKKEYDDAYADWGSSLQANLFVIRKLTGRLEYGALESPVENTLVPAFTGIDACLTKAYDSKISRRPHKPILIGCNMAGRMKRTLDVSYDLTEELFQAAVRDSSGTEK